ncbi:putative expansin/Lol pI [Rosa chinensis]|uniref:Expansin n=1 Tax=Rosa chinensis TaxID=74649 RepID=A0A2P6QHY9_ROSCH|nr:putative expansin/Lol pI [Rosa chinensis]
MVKVLLTAAVFISLLVHGMGGDNMTTWFTGATASFYGDMHGRGINKGACGYGDLKKQGYGLETTSLSVALFNDGLAGGACYALICVDDPVGCLPNAGAVFVTAINLCPPNYTEASRGNQQLVQPTIETLQVVPAYV